MTYTYPAEKYMELMEAYYAMEALSFAPEDSRETVISKLEERSAKKREIADIANAMVREYVETYEKDPAAMRPEDAETMEAFELLLLPPGSQRRSSRRITASSCASPGSWLDITGVREMRSTTPMR